MSNKKGVVMFPANASPSLYKAMNRRMIIQLGLFKNSMKGSMTEYFIKLEIFLTKISCFVFFVFSLSIFGINIKIMGPNKKQKAITINANSHE